MVINRFLPFRKLSEFCKEDVTEVEPTPETSQKRKGTSVVSVPTNPGFKKLLPGNLEMNEDRLIRKYDYAYHQTPTMIHHLYSNQYILKMCAAWEPLKGGYHKRMVFKEWVSHEKSNRSRLLIALSSSEDFQKQIDELKRPVSRYQKTKNFNVQLQEIISKYSRVDALKENDSVKAPLYEEIAGYRQKLTELEKEVELMHTFYDEAKSQCLKDAPKDSSAETEAIAFYTNVLSLLTTTQSDLDSHLGHANALYEKYKAAVGKKSIVESSEARKKIKNKKKTEKRNSMVRNLHKTKRTKQDPNQMSMEAFLRTDNDEIQEVEETQEGDCIVIDEEPPAKKLKKTDRINFPKKTDRINFLARKSAISMRHIGFPGVSGVPCVP